MDTVTAMQAKIAERLGPKKYKIWFKNTTHFNFAEGHLKVSTPNLFICNWIERNYSELIGQFAEEALGRPCPLSFVVDARLLYALRKHQLDSQAEFIAKNPERVAREARREGATPAARKLRGRFEDLVVGPAN